MKIFSSKNKRLLFSLLILGAIFRIFYIYFTKDWKNSLWIGICFILPIWITYAFLYDKDMYGPYGWNNGENQIGRTIITILTWGIYFLLVFKDLNFS